MFETNNPRLFGEGNGAGSGDDFAAYQRAAHATLDTGPSNTAPRGPLLAGKDR